MFIFRKLLEYRPLLRFLDPACVPMFFARGTAAATEVLKYSAALERGYRERIAARMFSTSKASWQTLLSISRIFVAVMGKLGNVSSGMVSPDGGKSRRFFAQPFFHGCADPFDKRDRLVVRGRTKTVAQ